MDELPDPPEKTHADVAVQALAALVFRLVGEVRALTGVLKLAADRGETDKLGDWLAESDESLAKLHLRVAALARALGEKSELPAPPDDLDV